MIDLIDRRSPDGVWMQCCSIRYGVSEHTRAGRLWMNLKRRCSEDRQKNDPLLRRYLGCKNGFEDFQHFAEWSHKQHGYQQRDANGRYWHLDKDLISPGNKIYAPEFCCFLPATINTLLIAPESEGDIPLGVHIWRGRYKASISILFKKITIGTFDDPLAAHAAWQKKKIDAINMAILMLGADHPKAVAGLGRIALQISRDLFCGQITPHSFKERCNAFS